jgi:hypothetical protein
MILNQQVNRTKPGNICAQAGDAKKQELTTKKFCRLNFETPKIFTEL